MSQLAEVSKTALMVTAYRARATNAQQPVCNDPWAGFLAGSEGHDLSLRYDKAFPDMVLWIGLRTRFLDDCVNHYMDRGFQQIVVLGAGFDTRSARLARPGVQFYEVDHPASQSEKLARVSDLDGYLPNGAIYVSCDFETQDFLDTLEAAGFDSQKPAVIIWEGVAYYLSQEIVLASCKRIATGCHPQSVLLFDFVGKAMMRGEGVSEQDKEMLSLLTQLGEPVQFGTNDLLPLLARAGFKHVRTISFDEICLSITQTYDRERRFRFQSIALASGLSGSNPWS
jgi:methyltransferase (TIGR00027 family)